VEHGAAAVPAHRRRRFALDEKFWLPVLACAAVILGLELLYRCTLVGRAFLAIAEDNYAASALGPPERDLRMASFALAGAIAGLAGFAGGQLLLASIANGPMLNFYGFVPVALGGLGNNRGAIAAACCSACSSKRQTSWWAGCSSRSPSLRPSSLS
jgi:branched-subunit amino acid ABC-type transport system permease component